MAIKGGLLDCEGRSENEENFNRIQERYGYEETVKNVETLLSWGGDRELTKNPLNAWSDDTTYGLVPASRFSLVNNIPTGTPLKIELKAEGVFHTFYSECKLDPGRSIMYVPLGGKFKEIREYYLDGNVELIFNEAQDESIRRRYATVFIQAYTIEDKSNVYPMNSKYLPAAEAVADAAGDTVTGEEFNALLTSLRSAGYLGE